MREKGGQGVREGTSPLSEGLSPSNSDPWSLAIFTDGVRLALMSRRKNLTC